MATIACPNRTATRSAKRLDLVHVVRREKHRRPALGQAADQLPRVAPARGVEAGGGLVEEEQRRVPDDAEPDVEPPLLSAGQTLHPVVRLLAEPDQLDDLVHRTRVRVVAGVAGEHLAHRVVRLDRQLLQHDTDPRTQPSLGTAIGGVHAEGLDTAAAAVTETLEDLDGRGLAGAVGAEQGEHLAPLHVEADVAHGDGVAVGLRQVLDGHGRAAGRGHAEQP